MFSNDYFTSATWHFKLPAGKMLKFASVIMMSLHDLRSIFTSLLGLVYNFKSFLMRNDEA